MAASGLFLVLAWALASPVGASPDEPTHIKYAWGTVTGQTVAGEKLVTNPVGYRATVIQFPQKLLQFPAPSCYWRSPEKPVTQCSPIPADSQKQVTHASGMSRYPPVFYLLDGAVLKAATSADLSGPRVLYTTRVAAGILSLLTFGFGVFLLARRFPARIVLLAALLGFPATAWFVAASVNPSGLEIAAAFLLAAGVLSVRLDHTLGTRSAAAIVAVPLGTLLLAWTRPLSFVWAGLILGLLLVPTSPAGGKSWSQRLPVRRLGAVAFSATVLILGSSIAWFGYALALRPSGGAVTNVDPQWAELNPLWRITLLVLRTGGILSDMVGNFGWLDTPLPTVGLIAWVAIATLAIAAWFGGRNDLVPRWSVGAVLGLGYLVALLDEYRGGWGWQGRYLLPVTAAVCVFAIPGITQTLKRLPPLGRVVPWLLGGLMAVNALSVVWFLFRNVYGISAWPHRLPMAPLPTSPASWTPPLGQGTVLALVSVALVCGVVAVWTLRPVPVGTEPDPSP